MPFKTQKQTGRKASESTEFSAQQLREPIPLVGGLSHVVKSIAILALAVVAAWGATSTYRHFRAGSLSNPELRKFLPPPSGPLRLKEACSDLHAAIAAAGNDPRFNSHDPIRSGLSLSQDELAVYRALLGDATRRGWKHLNISATTTPLSEEDFRACECFEDIDLENLPAAFHTFHDLAGIALPAREMRLVDPELQSSLVRAHDPGRTIRDGKLINDAVNAAFSTGLFSMSEIAFDKEHRYAVVSYRFWCGLLCGNGATLVFEKIGGEWKKSDRECGSWIF